MSTVKPFRCVRPVREKAAAIASLPYDVYSREESAEFVKDKPWSFLNIDRPETGFEPSHDMYAPEVYAYAVKTYQAWKDLGTFVQEEKPCYYVYELTMDGRTQTGITGTVAVSDYENGICKKHENTVAEKEADRIRHVDTMNAQTGPIFLAYRKTAELSDIVDRVKSAEPLFDFVTPEGIGQRVWVINDAETVAAVEKGFEHVPCTYIADGHHRAASAVKVSQKRRADGKASADSEHFLAVLFPDEELKIMDYNRIVKDLNGLTPEEFLKKIEKETPYRVSYVCEASGKEAEQKMKPQEKGQAGMCLAGKIYMLSEDPAYMASVADDPVKTLDVSVLQDTVLSPILGIGDPRTDKRIKFVGGIRGLRPLIDAACEQPAADGTLRVSCSRAPSKLRGLEARTLSVPLRSVHNRRPPDALHRNPSASGVSFAMYPTSMSELFAVADAGLLMPPKSTWFEPKLRSGLFIHEI